MNMQPGRNHPCHRGSGRLYEHCHLREDESAVPMPAAGHHGVVEKQAGEQRRALVSFRFVCDRLGIAR